VSGRWLIATWSNGCHSFNSISFFFVCWESIKRNWIVLLFLLLLSDGQLWRWTATDSLRSSDDLVSVPCSMSPSTEMNIIIRKLMIINFLTIIFVNYILKHTHMYTCKRMSIDHRYLYIYDLLYIYGIDWTCYNWTSATHSA